MVLIGKTGVGKTGLASGLLLKAVENGYRGLFIKAQDLFDEMYASIADRASRKLLRRWARLDLIVVDELGYLNLRPEQTNLFFKLMEERYRRKPTIITITKNSAAVLSPPLVLWSGLSAVTFLLLLVLFWRHNRSAYKRLYSQWERSFLWQRCGTLTEQE